MEARVNFWISKFCPEMGFGEAFERLTPGPEKGYIVAVPWPCAAMIASKTIYKPLQDFPPK